MLFLLPSLPVWAIPITWIELWTEYYISLFSEGKIKQLHKVRIIMLAPWVSPENSQGKCYQLIYYTKWECPKKFRTVLMWQPVFDGALSWLHFHLCCQKIVIIKNYVLQGRWTYVPCATMAPLQAHASLAISMTDVALGDSKVMSPSRSENWCICQSSFQSPSLT